MSTSLITRCPKCSTAFRVSEDMLNMAKGKVRCGQCFHIFKAQDHQIAEADKTTKAEAPNTKTSVSPPLKKANKPTPPLQELEDLELPVNPEWLDTLFDDDEKAPSAKPAIAKQASAINTADDSTKPPAREKKAPINKSQSNDTRTGTSTASSSQGEPAPWELELAEVEAALSSQPIDQDLPAKKKPVLTPTPDAVAVEQEPAQPDYMIALHSLAQAASEHQAKPTDQHSALEQLSAQQNLAPLLEDEPSKSKNNLTWLWFIGSLAGILLLAGQMTMYFFEQGSNSATFRSLYRTICTYSGCILPAYENLDAISIQHVRIQSHPSQENVLLVNAIITNNSPFSQAMPTMALEFFDLNGAPVAARLFAPNNYLHKDFLDITYMPPNTPIHVVISIVDPGANAVTHQLKALAADTQAY